MVSSVKRWMPLVSLLTISIVTVTTLFVAHTRSPAQELNPPPLSDGQPGQAISDSTSPVTPQDLSLNDVIPSTPGGQTTENTRIGTPAGIYVPPPQASGYVNDTPAADTAPTGNTTSGNATAGNSAPTTNGYGLPSQTLPTQTLPSQTLPSQTLPSPSPTGPTTGTNHPYFTPAQPRDFRPSQTAQAWSLPATQGYSNPNAAQPMPSGYPAVGPVIDASTPNCTTCQSGTCQVAPSQFANISRMANMGQFTTARQIPSMGQTTGDTWVRKIGPCSSTLSGVGGNLLRGELVGPEFRVVYTAEYSTTQDSVMYGVLQSVTIQHGVNGQTSDLEDLLEVEALSNKLIDQPFSARVRADGNQLVLKDVKFAGLDLHEDDDMGAIMRTVVVGSYAKQTAAPAPAVSLVPYPVYPAPVPQTPSYSRPPAPQAVLPGVVPQY